MWQNCKRQRGQSIVETMIILPAFGLLMFGILEVAYLLHAKATVNAATFDAARKGSVNHAMPSAMRDGMAGVLTALFVRKKPSNVVEVNTTVLKVKLLLNMPVAPRGWIDIISPSKAVFNQFKTKGYIKETNFWGKEKEVQKDLIPNDNLMWRSTAYKTIGSGATAVTVNLQDANLLKIRAVWCHKLLVPGLDRFIHWTYTWSHPGYIPQIPTTEQGRCDLHAAAVDKGSYYVPITSSAVVRMQSPIIADIYK